MAKKTHQVIVGNSAAALSALKAIRDRDQFCDITLISSESCNAYTPVAITHYLSGEISKDRAFLTDGDFYEKNDVVTILGDKAVGLDPWNQRIYLQDGRRVSYDNLLIATGVSPRSLLTKSIKTNKTNKVLSVWTMQDAERMSKLARRAKAVIVIGTGMIGLQVADALYKQGIKLTVLEALSQILPRNIDADCAKILQHEMKSRGISVFCGVNIAAIESRGKEVVVISDSGREFIGDAVSINIGVNSNVDWLRDTEIRINQGVITNEFMQATFENIFAAGDVAEVRNVITGQIEHSPGGWGEACIQGRTAGLNMTGLRVKYPGRLMENVATLFGSTVASIGLTGAINSCADEVIQFSNLRRKIYRKILLNQNRVVGAILLNEMKDAGIIRSLITKKVDVSILKDRIARTAVDLRALYTRQPRNPGLTLTG